MVAPFPSNWTVEWKTYAPNGKDPLGNVIDNWNDPVPRQVIGWSSRRVLARDGVSELEDTDHLDLTVSFQFAYGPKDHVIIPGRGEYMVEGIKDSDHGFHNWQPGLVLSLLFGEG